MHIKLKSVFFIISLSFNALIAFLLIFSSLSKNSTFYYHSSDDDNTTTAAAVISIPKDAKAAFDLLEITIKQGQKAYIQFSIITGNKKQGNVLLNALYDPEIISITNTGYGIEITGLKEGATLMQTFLNEGIKDLAFITIEQ